MKTAKKATRATGGCVNIKVKPRTSLRDALFVHETLWSNGWRPLVTIRYSTHWVNEGQRIIVAHEDLVEGRPIRDNRVAGIMYATPQIAKALRRETCNQ